jgi:signal transduction histidine kinase/CheY-like chemotaxis protein
MIDTRQVRTGTAPPADGGLEEELQVSLTPTIIGLTVLGMLLVLTSDAPRDSALGISLRLLGLLFYTIAAISWLLRIWHDQAARWFISAALIAVIYVGNRWLSLPSLLALLAIPTGLAALLIGPTSALATALGETVLLLISTSLVNPRVPPSDVAIALLLLWGMLGMLIASEDRARWLGRWSGEHYEFARAILEEARDRRGELEQALADLVQANRQLALANERLGALRLVAEEAQTAKAGFVAKVSHEFRTPLNMIIGLIDLLMETPEVYGQPIPAPLMEDLEIVQRNCEHLSSMVNDVLDLSQAEAGRLVLHREYVDLADLVEAGLAVVRPLLSKKGLDLAVTISPDLPEVYCDRTRIRQVILNLVSNAARYTDVGGVSVTVTRNGDCAAFSVTDTGPGISPEDTERIFEPFCQGMGSIWRDKGGSGLGLSISKQFIDLHGGRIWLRSELGVGTTFSVEIPIHPPQGYVARPGHWISEEHMWIERRRPRAGLGDIPLRPRVAVCDQTGSLKQALSHYSDEVDIIMVNSTTALVQEIDQCPVHAALLNTSSPDSLWPAVEEARRALPDTLVLGCCVPPRLEHAWEAGAAGYLTKPVKRADLLDAVQGVSEDIRRILLIDDDVDVLQLWRRMLEASDNGFEIVSAASGREALAKLSNQRPDLMLLDILMPDMSGWQLLEIKNRTAEIASIPVILVSAQDPADRPPHSAALLASTQEGLSLAKLLRCSLDLSALVMGSE